MGGGVGGGEGGGKGGGANGGGGEGGGEGGGGEGASNARDAIEAEAEVTGAPRVDATAVVLPRLDVAAAAAASLEVVTTTVMMVLPGTALTRRSDTGMPKRAARSYANKVALNEE